MPVNHSLTAYNRHNVCVTTLTNMLGMHKAIVSTVLFSFQTSCLKAAVDSIMPIDIMFVEANFGSSFLFLINKALLSTYLLF